MSWTELLFSFRGRIGRAPYWYFVLVVTVLYGAFFAYAGASMFNAASLGDANALSCGGGAMTIVPVVSLLLLWPSLAICAKRWHDVDKSAWWILIALVPAVPWAASAYFGLDPRTPLAIAEDTLHDKYGLDLVDAAGQPLPEDSVDLSVSVFDMAEGSTTKDVPFSLDGKLVHCTVHMPTSDPHDVTADCPR